MIVEVGKKYITRNGMLIEISREFYGLFYDQFDRIYNADGTFGKGYDQFDLVSEKEFTEQERVENNKKYII